MFAHLLNNLTTGSHTTVGCFPFAFAVCILHLYCTSSFNVQSLSLIGGTRGFPLDREFTSVSRAARGTVLIGGGIARKSGNKRLDGHMAIE